jgi:long-chain fatty acid transport protein
MARRSPAVFRRLAVSLFAVLFGASAARAQIGLLVTGVGPINRSMGGAAVAAPLDAAGALYWNPATMSGLDPARLDFGVELIYPQARLESSAAANAFGRGAPPIPLAGSDRSDSGVFPAPALGLAYRAPESPLTFGLGVYEPAGFAVNYPASLFNPILTPQPPRGVGLGALFADLQVVEVAPAVSYQLTDRLSVGFGAALDLAYFSADPLVVAPPDDADRDGFPTFGPGTHTRYHWGGGVQAGVYYTGDGGWRVGASVKSPRWVEPFHSQSVDELGRPHGRTFDADLPMVVSVGGSYVGFDRWLLATDLRYVNFANANGLRDDGFAPTGQARGVGWHDVFALALGAQYQLSDAVSVRAGYTFNQSPIDSAHAFFNIASPTILEHSAYLGASYKVTENFLLTAAYAHGFETSVQGPVVTPFGAVPGTSVKSVVSADAFLFGGVVKFGGCGCPCAQ